MAFLNIYFNFIIFLIKIIYFSYCRNEYYVYVIDTLQELLRFIV